MCACVKLARFCQAQLIFLMQFGTMTQGRFRQENAFVGTISKASFLRTIQIGLKVSLFWIPSENCIEWQ